MLSDALINCLLRLTVSCCVTVPGKHTPWALFLKSVEHPLYENYSIPHLAFLSEKKKMHQNVMFSVDFSFY